MSTTDIRTALDQAAAIIQAATEPTDARKALAAALLPAHKPEVAYIRVSEWLTGVRTPRDFAVCCAIVDWVKANKRRKNFTTATK
jgi:hypothetical protein